MDLGNNSYSGCPTLPFRGSSLIEQKKSGKKCVQAQELLAAPGNQGIFIMGTTCEHILKHAIMDGGQYVWTLGSKLTDWKKKNLDPQFRNRVLAYSL